MEISEEDVKKQVEEDFNESIRQQFTSSDNITEEEIAAYTEKMAEAKKLGFETCILPKVCLDMVKEIKGLKLLGVGNISDAINLL